MINRLNRFNGHGSLNYLYNKGQTVRGQMLTLKYVKGKNPDYRLAVVVSKKVSKKAVVRNRIRRRIYEIVRILKKSSTKSWPVDMAITVFDESMADIEHAKLEDMVKNLLNKAHII